MIAFRLIVCAAAFLVTGCATMPRAERLAGKLPQPIDIKVPLRNFPEIGMLTQRVAASFKAGQTRTLRFELELTPRRLVLVALTPLGLPAFALTYDGERSTVKTYLKDIPPALPDWILDDVLIANGPKAAVRSALARKRYRLEAGPNRRRIFDRQGRTVMRIRYSGPGRTALGRNLVLNDDLLHYRLAVTTVAKTLRAREP